MKTEDVGDGAINLGELTDDSQDFTPTGAESAVLSRNAQCQQAAVAQGITLDFGGATALVAFDGGQRELSSQSASGV